MWRGGPQQPAATATGARPATSRICSNARSLPRSPWTLAVRERVAARGAPADEVARFVEAIVSRAAEPRRRRARASA